MIPVSKTQFYVINVVSSMLLHKDFVQIQGIKVSLPWISFSSNGPHPLILALLHVLEI